MNTSVAADWREVPCHYEDAFEPRTPTHDDAADGAAEQVCNSTIFDPIRSPPSHSLFHCSTARHRPRREDRLRGQNKHSVPTAQNRMRSPSSRRVLFVELGRTGCSFLTTQTNRLGTRKTSNVAHIG